MYALVLLLLLVAAGDQLFLPNIDYGQLGGQIGVFGLFDLLLVYSQSNASSFLLSDERSHIYLRNSSDYVERVASTNGYILSLDPLGDDAVVVSGNFSALNNALVLAPLIYNFLLGETTELLPGVNSKVTALIDEPLIYLGGDFDFNGTHGAAVYDLSRNETRSLPFKGFGNGSRVNSIVKIPGNFSQPELLGSIVFGGHFDTLGLPELLVHNSTSKKNNTNTTYLLSAEQVVSLKHGIFSTVNSASDPRSIICPGLEFDFAPQSGGEWAVQLAPEMSGLVPTKLRIYLPKGEDGIKLFRIYTWPSGGIMNLTYLDPTTNEMAHCDAFCPLSDSSTLANITSQNARNKSLLLFDDTIFVDLEGSFSMYYDPSTKSKNLGYGRSYQEFALVNNVPIDKIGLTALAWYGNRAALSGFELYLNQITVFGNNTLNEPNCGTLSNSAVTNGTFQSVQLLASVPGDDYLVSQVNSSASVTLYPNISYAGNYSILMYTPGCSADGLCAKRLIVNVTVFDTEDTLLSQTQIYQDNLNEKFDYLFFGHMNGSSETGGRNRVQVDYVAPVVAGTQDPWMVVDKVVASIVSLDKYTMGNMTNSTNSNISHIHLNGLFEYSLGNFSTFEESRVKLNGSVLPSNHYVGNSTINRFSGSSGGNISQLLLDNHNLVILGKFPNGSSIASLALAYNGTSNQTMPQKRETILGTNFNGSFAHIAPLDGGLVALGAFSSLPVSDLSTNKSAPANNYALRKTEWFSFGNPFSPAVYDHVAQTLVRNTSYYIFSSNSTYNVWDQTNHKWGVQGAVLDISSVAQSGDDQLVAGLFGIMDYTGSNAAHLLRDGFDGYGFDVDGHVLVTQYVNTSVSVLGGRFNALGAQNFCILRNGSSALSSEDARWASDTAVTAMYVDETDKMLFMGTNGLVDLKGDVAGLVLFNLANNSFTDVQPASLSNNGAAVAVNALALYNDQNLLLVAGSFSNAGLLECANVCIYDVTNTRWTSPATSNSSSVVSGEVYAATFILQSQVLLGGNMSFGGTHTDFAVYSFDSSAYTPAKGLQRTPGVVKRFLINDTPDGTTNNRMVAYGDDFVAGFDRTLWTRIDAPIQYGPDTRFSDMRLVQLAGPGNGSQRYFDKDRVLLLTGSFNITGYGPTNAALYDGNRWVPYFFSASNATLGLVNAVLLKDIYHFQSSNDLRKMVKHMSAGKVVGISLACAIGLTGVVGLAYLIPMMYLFKRTRQEEKFERIQEDEMMDVVNPEDLLHEIDLQKNT